MSRTIPIALAAKYAAGTAQLCQCLRLARKDGLVVRLTSAPRDVVVPSGTLTATGQDMGGTYLSSPGITPTDVEVSSGLAVGNLEILFGREDAYVNRADVLQGLWAKTAFNLFQCDPIDPGAGVDEQMRGHLGDIDVTRQGFRAELRSILQLLQQPIGRYTSKTCVVSFGSQGDGMCNIDLPAWTKSGTLTQVLSNQIVVDSSRGEADDYFGAGLFRFTSGNLAGVECKVKAFSAGQFTFDLPTYASPAPGDGYVAVAGCRKTRDACKAKGNILNMQAEPDLPGQDKLTSPP